MGCLYFQILLSPLMLLITILALNHSLSLHVPFSHSNAYSYFCPLHLELMTLFCNIIIQAGLL